MAKERKPGPGPEEEELSLSGGAAPRQEAAADAPGAEPAQELNFGKRVPKLQLPESATERDVLSAVLHAPEEGLYVWEPVALPSDGVYYGWESNTQIRVRPMTQRAEQTLATQRLSQTGMVIDMLFEECCRFPDGFTTADMLVGDRNFLLFYLRGITYGNDYEFAAPCPDDGCGKTNTYKYDLNELQYTIRRANPALGNEPFRVSLPHLSAVTGHQFWVGLRFLRGVDLQHTMERRRRKKTATVHSTNSNPFQRRREQSGVELDTTLPDYLEQTIVTVLGDANPMTRREFITRLHPDDSNAIGEWLRINTPGIDSRIDMSCPSCGRDFKVDLPITEEFFRPKKPGGVRA